MTGRPVVTVLTPTYNRPDYLPDAIRSVLAQELADWEMLVINDGGCDVADIVEDFGDPRIRYFNRPENRGKAACLNFGLRRARGEYVAYLDDDDAWYANHLRVLAGALEANPGCGAAYSDLYRTAVLVDESGRRYPLDKRIDICRDYNRMFMFHFNHTLHVSLMHRRRLALRAGGYNESVRVLIDWDMTRKLSFYTDFVHLPVATGEYYVPIANSDRISDVERRDTEKYRCNVRRIRAALPPEPWPKVERVAVIYPLRALDERDAEVVRYFADRIEHPARIRLVSPDPDAARRFLTEALGNPQELDSFAVLSGPAGPGRQAYLAGARSIEADYYYLASRELCTDTEMRLIRALAFTAEADCAVVRWPEDEAGGDWDVFVCADALREGEPPWPGARRLAGDWYPPQLRADLLVNFAGECERQGDYAAARELLRRAAAVPRGGVGEAFLVRRFADVCFAQGDYDEAERMCRRLVERGYGADNWLRLGRVHQGRREFERAAGAYRRALEDIGTEEEDLEADVFPLAGPVQYDLFLAAVGLGECLGELGRPEEAARWLRRAARVQVNSHRPNLAFGRLFLQEGDLNRAEQALRLAAARCAKGERAEVDAMLAQVHERRGEPEAALELAQRAARAEPSQAHLNRCVSLAKGLDRTDELEEVYRRFLDHRPGHVGALLGLAELLAESGRAQEAAESAERAALLDPDNRRAARLLKELRRQGQEPA